MLTVLSVKRRRAVRAMCEFYTEMAMKVWCMRNKKPPIAFCQEACQFQDECWAWKHEAAANKWRRG